MLSYCRTLHQETFLVFLMFVFNCQLVIAPYTVNAWTFISFHISVPFLFLIRLLPHTIPKGIIISLISGTTCFRYDLCFSEEKTFIEGNISIQTRTNYNYSVTQNEFNATKRWIVFTGILEKYQHFVRKS